MVHLSNPTEDCMSEQRDDPGGDQIGERRRSNGRGVTRREVLKTLGTGAATAAVSPAFGFSVLAGGALPAEAAEGDGDLLAERIPAGPALIELRINGAARRVTVEPRTTLLSALRNRLDLTGTKEVCNRGACGGCTVIVDGRAVNSCLMLALDARGREIRTIEGLARGRALDPVQAAFVEHDALMCGFCTPGMVMSVRALLDRTPSPTLEDVRRATAGNICRCGAYPKVFEAALAAVRNSAGRGSR